MQQKYSYPHETSQNTFFRFFLIFLQKGLYHAPRWDSPYLNKGYDNPEFHGQGGLLFYNKGYHCHMGSPNWWVPVI